MFFRTLYDVACYVFFERKETMPLVIYLRKYKIFIKIFIIHGGNNPG